jgi:hypothetical protein
VWTVLLSDFCASIMKKRLIISTEEVNRYGYRVLSGGGRFDKYMKNPVLLFGHNWSEAPIGRLEDIQLENGNITAIPVFDEDDEFGLACKHKWEKGFLFAASIYFDPISTSSDTALILPGQSGETVTEWDLLEVSMVTIPGNGGAAVGMSLSYRSSTDILSLTKPIMDFTKIAQALNLTGDVITEELIVLAIEKLKTDNNALSASRIDTLLATGKANGNVTADNEKNWRALAMKDFDSTANLLNVSAPEQPNTTDATKPAGKATILGMLSSGNQTQPPAANGREAWTFDDWSKKDHKGLSAMRKEDPKRYEALAQQKLDAVQ